MNFLLDELNELMNWMDRFILFRLPPIIQIINGYLKPHDTYLVHNEGYWIVNNYYRLLSTYGITYYLNTILAFCCSNKNIALCNCLIANGADTCFMCANLSHPQLSPLG